MTNPFTDFQSQIDSLNQRHAHGELSADERDNQARQLQLNDTETGDTWMLSPQGQWFRRANGSRSWLKEYPPALIDPTSLPAVPEMDIHQLAYTIHHCTRCPLHDGRKRAVPGEGPVPADLMLIGEGPGFHEDQQARPFVGKSGQFLEELLGKIGYQRQEVFIANVVKCRPPNNRDPQPEELTACRSYLDRQIELVNPKVIVTLGRFSMYRYFPGQAITKIHGQPKRVDHRLIVPMFHPAAALRNAQWKPLIIEDFNRLPALIHEAASFEAENSAPDREQLSMF